jgi:hypothetical protein
MAQPQNPQTRNRIVLEFGNDAEDLALALEYLGDTNAPVLICGGEVVVNGQSFELWDEYDAAVAAAENSDGHDH